MQQLPTQAPYLFVIAQPEAKSWLCAELLREHPELRIAFSRPGLYTWKHSGGHVSADFRLRSIFARHYDYGYSLGRLVPGSSLGSTLGAFDRPMRLHVYGRDPGEGKPSPDLAGIEAVRLQILDTHPGRFHADATPQPGDWVLDVILSPPAEVEEPWFLGYHRHDPSRSPHPGGVARLVAPDVAPSRAYCKLEELLRWASFPMKAGDVAVEIGCAPGGAVVAMLDRGVRVFGVDPAQIDPRVVQHACAIGADFSHVNCPIAALTRQQLPPKVDWLLCDANLAPQVAVRALAHWAKLLRPQLRGLVFTMKMNDQRAVDAIPKLMAQVGQFGLGVPRAVQLPSHRREIVVFAVKSSDGSVAPKTRPTRNRSV